PISSCAQQARQSAHLTTPIRSLEGRPGSNDQALAETTLHGARWSWASRSFRDSEGQEFARELPTTALGPWGLRSARAIRSARPALGRTLQPTSHPREPRRTPRFPLGGIDRYAPGAGQPHRGVPRGPAPCDRLRPEWITHRVDP